MLPKEKDFGFLISHLDLNKEDTIIAYDDYGVISSCRVFWTLKSFGFENVYVLDGGLDKWKE